MSHEAKQWITCRFSEFLNSIEQEKRFIWGSCRNITLFGVRAEILLSWFIAPQESCAGPFWGVVQKYYFLEKYSPLTTHPHFHSLLQGRELCAKFQPQWLNQQHTRMWSSHGKFRSSNSHQCSGNPGFQEGQHKGVLVWEVKKGILVKEETTLQLQ